MLVLSVVVGLLVLLTAACVWESRTGRPEWGRRPPTSPDPSRAAKAQIAAAAVVAAAALEMGGDG